MFFNQGQVTKGNVKILGKLQLASERAVLAKMIV